jgi:uncharacterized protein YkwD
MRKFRESFVISGREALLRAFALVFLAATTACAGSPSAPSDALGAPSATLSSATADLSEELAYCADEVNRYRASIGRKSLSRSASLEDFAAAAAQHDSAVRVPHQHFSNTGGGGIAMAETEILWWRGYAIRAAIKQGLAQMWKVGPGGEHYDILAGNYTEVGCGVFVSNGEVTVAQDFR